MIAADLGRMAGMKFQFTIRSLLWLTVAVAVIAAIALWTKHRNEQMIEAEQRFLEGK